MATVASTPQGIPQARFCHCGECRACRETARFIATYERNHGAEEREYYRDVPDPKSPTGSNWKGLLEASRFPFGTARVRRTRTKRGES